MTPGSKDEERRVTTANEPSVAELVAWLKSYSANVDGHGSDCVRHAVVALTRLERRCAEAEAALVTIADLGDKTLVHDPLELEDVRRAYSLGAHRAFGQAAAIAKTCLPPERANEGKS